MQPNFQHTRPKRRLNKALQILLCLGLFIAINWIGVRHFSLLNLTPSAPELSAQTQGVLESLSPTRLTFVYSGAQATPKGEFVLKDIHALLDAYAYAARNIPEKPLSITRIDADRNPAAAAEATQQLGIERANVLLIQQAGRTRVLSPERLYTVREGQPVLFVGERALSSALVTIAEQVTPTIAFITGHGEADPFDTHPLFGLSSLAETLRMAGANVRQIDLSTLTAGVPAGIDVLVSAAPKTSFLNTQLATIENFLQAGGSLALFLDGRIGTNPTLQSLENIFYNWGILVDGRVVVETDPASLTQRGDVLVRQFSRNPIMRRLSNQQIPLLLRGPTLAVRPDPGAPLNLGRSVSPLFASSVNTAAAENFTENFSQNELTSWAATSLAEPFDAFTDVPGPISYALLSTAQGPAKSMLNFSQAKVFVMGTSSSALNGAFDALGNRLFYEDLFAHLIGAPRALNIPGKTLPATQVPVTKAQLQTIAAGCTLAVLLVALIGALVAWRRRK